MIARTTDIAMINTTTLTRIRTLYSDKQGVAGGLEQYCPSGCCVVQRKAGGGEVKTLIVSSSRACHLPGAAIPFLLLPFRLGPIWEVQRST